QAQTRLGAEKAFRRSSCGAPRPLLTRWKAITSIATPGCSSIFPTACTRSRRGMRAITITSTSKDINLLADLGFNAYRFSIEWGRIEPEKGCFSHAELDHYRRMLEACHRRGLTPLVTYSHFTLPRWFAFQGAWENTESADLFARYCEKSTARLGDLIAYAATFNEPDLPHLFRWINLPNAPGGSDLAATMAAQKAAVRQQLNAPLFASLL